MAWLFECLRLFNSLAKGLEPYHRIGLPKLRKPSAPETREETGVGRSGGAKYGAETSSGSAAGRAQKVRATGHNQPAPNTPPSLPPPGPAPPGKCSKLPGKRAHGVVVSHPLSMREALGSIPSVSMSFF